jgi:hypothetical protein
MRKERGGSFIYAIVLGSSKINRQAIIQTMAIDLDENVAELLADRYLNKLPANEWAIKALEHAFDSRNLRILASMHGVDSPYEMNAKERLALAELGWDKHPPYVFMITWARRLAKQILRGVIEPRRGSAELYTILYTINAHFELGAWYAIDDLLDHNDYKGIETSEDEVKALIFQGCEELLRKTDSNFGELPGTSFEQAEALFKIFLKDNNISTNLHWIFREDIEAESWNSAIMRTPLPPENRELTKQYFELGKKRNLGVAITTLSTLNGEPCCFIVLPEDDTDAQYRLMGNRYIKFSFSVVLRDARPIRNPIIWYFKQFFRRRGGRPYWVDDIPSRQFPSN